MNYWTIIKSDYLQRTRSYSFLITLAISLAMAYSFVPSIDAGYSTIRIDDYVGHYNSAWIGSVTAIMCSIFLSLIGFYLVNSGIKKDIDSGVGAIVATTRIKNFTYLLTKTLSNFLVLMTIVALVFIMSIVLFFVYRTGFPFNLWNFALPYLLIPVPVIFLISALAVVFEVLLGRWQILQNILFFFLFTSMAVITPQKSETHILDVYGTKMVTQDMERTVQELTKNTESKSLAIGYVIRAIDTAKRFEYEGADYSVGYALGRMGLPLAALVLIGLVTPFFHRFDIKRRLRGKSETSKQELRGFNEIELSTLPAIAPDFGIATFFKTELVLMMRKGPKWLWFVNLGGMIALAFTPLKIAHTIVLPILWFLQVSRWSELVTKEKTFGVHYFSFASYRPLSRLLMTQLLAGICLAVTLALPLMVRYMIAFDFITVATLFLGAIFIVLMAGLIGLLSGGKKLFEILFFMVTYGNINAIPVLDYFGGSHQSTTYLFVIVAINLAAIALSLFIRSLELKRA